MGLINSAINAFTLQDKAGTKVNPQQAAMQALSGIPGVVEAHVNNAAAQPMPDVSEEGEWVEGGVGRGRGVGAGVVWRVRCRSVRVQPAPCRPAPPPRCLPALSHLPPAQPSARPQNYSKAMETAKQWATTQQ